MDLPTARPVVLLVEPSPDTYGLILDHLCRISGLNITIVRFVGLQVEYECIDILAPVPQVVITDHVLSPGSGTWLRGRHFVRHYTNENPDLFAIGTSQQDREAQRSYCSMVVPREDGNFLNNLTRAVQQALQKKQDRWLGCPDDLRILYGATASV